MRELLGESIIVVRDKRGTLRGFFNVCRHRGSRICDHDGTAAHLICPYHAWSFNLDGYLRAAPALAEEIDKRQLGLRPIAVRDIGGVILASLQASCADLDAVAASLEPGMRFHGIPEARSAVRRNCATAAIWKLVIENFIVGDRGRWTSSATPPRSVHKPFRPGHTRGSKACPHDSSAVIFRN